MNTISIIQFKVGKKLTFDEAKFKIIQSDNGAEVFVVLVSDPNKVILKCKWEDVLYIRHGVIKKTYPKKSDLGNPTDSIEEVDE